VSPRHKEASILQNIHGNLPATQCVDYLPDSEPNQKARESFSEAVKGKLHPSKRNDSLQRTFQTPHVLFSKRHENSQKINVSLRL